jgi:salicylate hydroxylase
MIESASDIKFAFLAYDALRRPRSQELVRRSREQGHMLELESELLSLSNGDRGAWKEYLEREMDLNPRWVWNVDLESMLLQAKETFKNMKEEEESAVEF